MDLSALFNVVKEYVPIPVIVAVAANIMLVYGSSFIVSVIEEYLEDTYGKDYRCYKKMICHLCLAKGYVTMERVLTLPQTDRRRLGQMLMRETGASDTETAKLLRL